MSRLRQAIPSRGCPPVPGRGRCGAASGGGLALLLAALLLSALAPAAPCSGVLAAGADPPAAAPAAAGVETSLGERLPLWTVAPFLGLLLSIALGPLLGAHLWHRHFPKVSAFWALVFAVPFVMAFRGAAVHEILHVYLRDYLPFLILLWALFTTSGGLLLRGTLAGTPAVNLLLLLAGTLLASWIGTTGAAMVMIRPLLKANAWRRHRVHVVIFFIFLVANIGGSLTPLGDPPLFLGFLHGVPFFWTVTHLFAPMALATLVLLAVFFAWDTLLYRREQPGRTAAPGEPLRLEGGHNLLLLGGIIAGVLMSGTWRIGEVTVLGITLAIQDLLRDGILILMGALSLFTTRAQTRRDNGFSWFPIKEVAYLFAGIFMTIIPALAILRAGSHGALAGLLAGVKEPGHYFWAAGGLSSFLDNAPTYLTFFNSVLGRFYESLPEAQAVAALIESHGVYLQAISVGAVFMGANTYIGNAPNFMVRSIALEAGVNMPGFFGYLIRFSIPVLVPLYLLMTLVFFR